MTEQELVRRFCKLHLTKDQSEQLNTDANTLLDKLISCGHWMGGGDSNLQEKVCGGTYFSQKCIRVRVWNN